MNEVSCPEFIYSQPRRKKSTRNFPLPICLKKLVNSQQPSAILLYASRRKQSAILRKIYYLFSKFLSMTLNFLVLMSNAKEITCPMIIRHWILVHSKQNYLVFQKFIILFSKFLSMTLNCYNLGTIRHWTNCTYPNLLIA